MTPPQPVSDNPPPLILYSMAPRMSISSTPGLPRASATRFPRIYYGPQRLSHPNLTNVSQFVTTYSSSAASIPLVSRQTWSVSDPPFVLTIATVLVDTLDPRSVPRAHVRQQ